MRVLDLFSGIGGFSLGLERTGGFRTVAFCEIEPYARRVLAKHWPEVPCYDDVRTLTAERLRADGISVDVICGGFPCQDISVAGVRGGIDGARSGLWGELSRLIGELRPRFAIVENVANLLAGERGTWFGRVLGDLAEIGFDAEWHCIPASAVGAPHIRDRVWVVAYPNNCERAHEEPQRVARREGPLQLGRNGPLRPVADTDARHGHRRSSALQMGRLGLAEEIARTRIAGGTEWSVEPSVGRVAHGVPSRLDRLQSLGNAVVPQIPELIGRAILAAEAA